MQNSMALMHFLQRKSHDWHAPCRLPAESRTIPLETIAQRTKLSVDGVEFLLMKTLSLHLIEGIIDQVDATVQVSLMFSRN